jgi:hypothetical protein
VTGGLDAPWAMRRIGQASWPQWDPGLTDEHVQRFPLRAGDAGAAEATRVAPRACRDRVAAAAGQPAEGPGKARRRRTRRCGGVPLVAAPAGQLLVGGRRRGSEPQRLGPVSPGTTGSSASPRSPSCSSTSSSSPGLRRRRAEPDTGDPVGAHRRPSQDAAGRRRHGPPGHGRRHRHAGGAPTAALRVVAPAAPLRLSRDGPRPAEPVVHRAGVHDLPGRDGVLEGLWAAVAGGVLVWRGAPLWRNARRRVAAVVPEGPGSSRRT